MKSALMLFTALWIISFNASAANIDPHLETRLAEACIRSIEENNTKLPNYKNVCKCIANKHYGAASSDISQAHADRHINWAVTFYETTDMDTLQKMADDKNGFSNFDDQAVNDCMGQGL